MVTTEPLLFFSGYVRWLPCRLPTSLVCGYPCAWVPLLVDDLPCYGQLCGWVSLLMGTVGRLPCWWAPLGVGSPVDDFSCWWAPLWLSFAVGGLPSWKLVPDCKPGTIILFSNVLGHISETFKIIFIYLWEFHTNILIIFTLHFPFSTSPGLPNPSFFQFYDLFLLDF